jgi:hypothetical protein
LKHEDSGMDVTDIRPSPALGGAMEGQGFYNAHSRPQAAAASRGLELLAEAAGVTGLPPAGMPIVIADLRLG